MTDEIHVSTRDRPGDYDALETAKAGEPIFVVQGGEPLGPPTVQHWADLAREAARELMHGPKDLPDREREEYEPTEEQRAAAAKLLRKATQAEEVSWEMLAYQRGDQPVAETRARYNEAVDIPADQGATIAQRKALISGVAVLHNAEALANEVREVLLKLELPGDACEKITQAVHLLRLAASMIEPRRAGERS